MRWLVISAALLGLTHTAIAAQVATLTVERSKVGFGGLVRPGAWTGVLVEIDYQGADAKRVRCRWLLPDADGDEVVYQRAITLTPKRTQRAWLYGKVPLSTTSTTIWQFQLIDDATGRFIDKQEIVIPELVEPATAMIGVLNKGRPIGLAPYTENLTQHEEIKFSQDLLPGELPDRWYGYGALEAVIWTPAGGDPQSPDISPQAYKSLRQWVHRGGHLVIAMPAIGESWTSSPLRDLLEPIMLEQVTSVPPPSILGVAIGDTYTEIDYLRLIPKGDQIENVTVLFREEERNNDSAAIVVAYAAGLGRITVCGVDLSDRSLARMRLPNRRDFWNTIFSWRSPALPAHVVKQRLEKREIYPMMMRDSVELSRFIGGLVAMKGTFKTALILSLFFFGMYWLTAGPGSFVLLKQRGWVKYTWVGFAAVVIVFTAIAWGGASVMRPLKSRIEHFSVITAVAGQPEVRSHSWLSLFVPSHGEIDVALQDDREEPHRNVISAPGVASANVVFFDPRRYVVDSGDPSNIAMPFRSTAKQLELDWVGPSDLRDNALMDRWMMPTGELKLVNGWPTGTLIHELPKPLTDLLVIYCPGDGREPYVFRLRDAWKPGVPLNINRAGAQAGGVEPLVREVSSVKWTGFLWKKMGNKPLHRLSEQELELLRVADDDMRNGAELLSLYSTLPPPAWWRKISTQDEAPVHYYRSLGREMDLTRYLPMRRLIILGYVEQSSLPLPLSVDGDRIDASGWTVVRWISPIHDSVLDEEPRGEETDEGA